MDREDDGQYRDVARGYEQQFEFAAAFREYLSGGAAPAPHDPRNEVEDLVSAVINLERSEPWRAHVAVWEFIGDRVSGLCEGPAQRADARRIFHLYNLDLDYWREPRPDYLPEGYYARFTDPTESKRRHQRALAYLHAAEQAASAQRYSLATRLQRKAAIAWIASDWGKRDPRDSDSSDDGWSSELIRERYGQKWEWAARSFFRAALLAVSSEVFDSKDEWQPKYSPDVVRWRGDDPRKYLARVKDEEQPQTPETDRQWMSMCWQQWELARLHAGDVERHATRFTIGRDRRRQECRQLEVLQYHLARSGRSEEARDVYVTRQSIALKANWHDLRATLEDGRAVAKWPRFLLRAIPRGSDWLYSIATGSGTSVRRTLASVAVLYLVLWPLVFVTWNLVVHEDPGTRSEGVGFASSVLFSASNVVQLPVLDLAPSGTAGAVAATVQALLAYFVFGYTVWVMLRSFEA